MIIPLICHLHVNGGNLKVRKEKEFYLSSNLNDKMYCEILL